MLSIALLRIWFIFPGLRSTGAPLFHSAVWEKA
jgi:hypothetical protein